MRRIVIPKEATCLGCGYSLQYLTRCQCPECGRYFDPFDRKTYKLPYGSDGEENGAFFWTVGITFLLGAAMVITLGSTFRRGTFVGQYYNLVLVGALLMIEIFMLIAVWRHWSRTD